MSKNDETKYRVISTTDWARNVAGEMELQINKMVKEGYLPIGNLVATSNESYCTLFQVMIKGSENDDDNLDILEDNI